MGALADASRLARIVRSQPCGGLPRSALWRQAFLPADEFKTALMVAYRKRWIDFVRDYVVVSTAPEPVITGPGAR